MTSRIYKRVKLTEETRRRLSLAKMGDKNPMKRLEVRKKARLSHLGQIAWNKGLTGKEYIEHYPNGIKGGREKGYKHLISSRKLMSKNTIGKKHKVNWTEERRKESSDRMKKNRQNLNFNKKMFASLQRSVTKPHIKVQELIKEYTKLKIETNYAFKVGLTFGSIDEADTEKKIAIFIDGNYWHNYPKLRKWDKCCNTTLKNQGWKVLRF